ncbi:LOW QUALITY PROTEIN: exosome component 10 [Nylanderia fulva]|uniref:LOW QUALITY PROTEIN: exosome component 10 n=1 Tax=Nylanderia fulva TaxID=613905 RepID=UPI0010FB418D|nr:LOW QUALITY PROTEIN: exosome component 10 [Nylanderia fulva]
MESVPDETFDTRIQEGYDVIRAGIKAANNLPAGDNFNYYVCFPSFNEARNKGQKKILAAMQTIIKTAGGSSNIESADVDDKFEVLLEINDQLLDQANILMDEESGILRNPQVELIVSQMPKPIVNGSWNIRSDRTNEGSDSSEKIRLLAAKNVQRPQLMFKDKINNSSKPWMPRIKEKPNSLKPLALYVEEGEQGEVFNHPYEFELDKFNTPECQLKKSVPVQYKPLENTEFKYIEKTLDIKILLEDLKSQKEIAIDLEHHSYRTFQGITCLMQISTVNTDYLIDTLALRSELHQLNEIFTKPTILKVFHGADMDILWLQRDLSLYVVNMFDTHQAAKQLNLPYLSLAYLLSKYCGISPNKHFQLADWRIRPLPTELMRYAREDTHYLLYIKDKLKNELIESANGKSNILKSVYDRCTDLCKRTYVKSIWTEESCMNMYKKSQKSFNNKQMYALLELHKWRDITAREEDDSIGYVLPNHMLLNIAETLPREMQGILACCNPIPPLVRQNVLKLHKIVLKARDQPLVMSIPEQDIRQRPTQQTHVVDSRTSLYTPHDIPSGTEARTDLPCLLDENVLLQQSKTNQHQTVKHNVTLFDTPDTSEDEEMKDSNEKKKVIFVSPYMRYKCVLPMVAHYEAKEREKQQKEEEKPSTVQQKEGIDETEINESKDRVYEHFKQMSQTMNKEVEVLPKKKKKKKKPNQFTLNQIAQYKKRKRESNVINKTLNDYKNCTTSFSTSTSDASVMHPSKKMKREETSQESKGKNNPEVIASIRARKKNEKKANQQMLKSQGMLPSAKFDYKSVDFSSFQGGSTVDSAENSSGVAQVDCLGLGKTVAMSLEGLFRSKPNGSDALEVRFFLSSRKQPRRVEVVLGEQFGLEWTDFKIERRTVVIVHGFLSHGQEKWISDMERTFLQWGDVNVLVVDWSAGSNTWNYYKAAVNTRIVGYQISKFIEHITNNTISNEGPNTSNWGPLHMIGHSLGAHICGMTAKELKKRQSRWTVQRITGLDPAQPCFRNADPSVHLHKNDASFIDVIHTNGRLLLSLGLGLPEAIGHVDFYPNGGKTQPGCVKTETSYFDYLQIPTAAIQKAICSHGRSYLYFTESLASDAAHNCSFWAHHWNMTFRHLSQIIAEPCDVKVCSEMGIRAEMYRHRGTFFVATAGTPPFCANSTDVNEEVDKQLRKEHYG